MVQVVTKNQRIRGLKKFFAGKPAEYRAICHKNFEALSKAELIGLKSQLEVNAGTGYLDFEASYKSYDLLSKSLSTVDRLYLTLTQFYAKSLPEFHDKIKRLPISLFLEQGDLVRINVVSKNCRLHHTQNLKKIILETWGLKASVNNDKVNGTVFIAGFQDRFIVRLEWTADPLYRRYYRNIPGSAPLRPTAAALLLRWVGFEKFPIICDPFCGSGIFLLEAARMAQGAQVHREVKLANWGLTGRSPNFEKEALPMLIGSDMNKGQVEAALHNKGQAGDWASKVTFEHKQFDKNFSAPAKTGLIIANLPFSERVSFTGLSGLSSAMRLMERIFQGWSFCFVTGEKLYSTKSILISGEKILYSGGKKRFATIGQFLDNQGEA